MKSESSFSLPCDIEKFNKMAKGKGTYKDELLKIFFANVAENLAIMERNCKSGTTEEWLHAAEEMKAIAESVGATDLAKISELSKTVYRSTSQEKTEILMKIKAIIQSLKAFLRNTLH